MAKARALGKGLGALIPAPAHRQEEKKDSEVTVLPIGALTPSPSQPRKGMDDEGLDSLAESIRAHGVVQPIVVRASEGGTYEIVAGERRWRAAGRAGLQEVPVRLFTGSDRAVREISLIENIQREDLSALEVASALSELLQAFSLTQEDIASRIGWSRTAVTNKLRLLQLPEEIRAMMTAGLLTEGHGRALLALDSASAMIALAKAVPERGLSVRQLEEAVRRATTARGAVERPRKTAFAIPAQVRKRARSLGIGLRASSDGGRIRLAMDGLDDRQVELLFELLQRDIFAADIPEA